MRTHIGQGAQGHLNLSTDYIVDRDDGAFVGHVKHIDSGGLLECFTDQVEYGANTRCSVGELARIALGVVDQFLQ